MTNGTKTESQNITNSLFALYYVLWYLIYKKHKINCSKILKTPQSWYPQPLSAFIHAYQKYIYNFLHETGMLKLNKCERAEIIQFITNSL